MIGMDRLPTRVPTIEKDSPPLLIQSMSWQVSMLVVIGLLASAVFAYAINRWRRTGRSDMFWTTLGAMSAVFYEPLGDLLVDIVYHQADSLTVLTAFGITIPLWVLPCYAVFFGPGVLALSSLLERGISRQRLFGLFAVAIVGTFLFEATLLKMGALTYFGSQQPVKIFDYPVWMAFSNSAVIFVVAMLVYASTKTAFVRKYPACLALLVPSFIIGVGVTTLVPIGFGMNSTTSLVIINLCAAGSAILSVAYVWVGSAILAPSSTRVEHRAEAVPAAA
ncbi:hypothetical protein [Mycolicibacter senuensis]|uniref:hypothetical protein n=1 Tax=Mycolicibacter senuensis TaxID=386913 RepID=UPI000DD821C2|nr:hypothetical protein [Mycolicibacter senuensis]